MFSTDYSVYPATTTTPLTTTPFTSISTIPLTTNTININTDVKSLSLYSYNLTTKQMKNLTCKDGNMFKDIIEYKKNKVYKFVFEDNKEVKTICDDEDIFSLEFAFYLALAKKIYGKELTSIGLMKKAEELSYQKYYAKLVDKGMKLFKALKEDEEKKKEKEKLKKEQYKRLIEKKKKRDKRLEERGKENIINLITEAIKRSKEEN